MVQKFKNGATVTANKTLYLFNSMLSVPKGVEGTVQCEVRGQSVKGYKVHIKGLGLINIMETDLDLAAPEIDLHVYPDTPKGTELVVTQDTISLSGMWLPKGELVYLRHSYYTPCGGYRYVTDTYGRYHRIDCDHLMIRGA